jgi:hypothetical protein
MFSICIHSLLCVLFSLQRPLLSLLTKNPTYYNRWSAVSLFCNFKFNYLLLKFTNASVLRKVDNLLRG